MLRSLVIRIALVAAPSGCELVTEPLYSVGLDSGAVGLDSGPRDSGDGSDSGLDSAPCVDADFDGVCADRDCDDSEPRKAPGFREFCVDHIDNDCDELVDFEDACDVTNDRCEPPFAILQQLDRPQTVWVFDGLGLGDRYEDDYMAATSAASGDCAFESGSGGDGEGGVGGDAVFKIIAMARSQLEVTVTGRAAVDPVLYLRPNCLANPMGDGDICSEGNGPSATLQTNLSAGDERYLFVDENRPGPVDLRVELTRM